MQKRRDRNYPGDLTGQLQIVQENQEQMDQSYNNLCNLLHDEMEKYCPVKKMGSTKKYYRTKQPY